MYALLDWLRSNYTKTHTQRLRFVAEREKERKKRSEKKSVFHLTRSFPLQLQNVPDATMISISSSSAVCLQLTRLPAAGCRSHKVPFSFVRSFIRQFSYDETMATATAKETNKLTLCCLFS